MKAKRYIAVWVALIAAIVAIFFSGGGKETYRTASGVVWHTTYNITYEAAENLDDSIIAVTNAIDRSA